MGRSEEQNSQPLPWCSSSIGGSCEHAHVFVLASLALWITISRVLCLSHALLVPVSLYQIWFYAHTAYPYPDKLDKSDLSKKTGMNMVSRYRVLFLTKWSHQGFHISSTKWYLSTEEQGHWFLSRRLVASLRTCDWLRLVPPCAYSLRHKSHTGSIMHVSGCLSAHQCRGEEPKYGR
jgi:hypothetical protein